MRGTSDTASLLKPTRMTPEIGHDESVSGSGNGVYAEGAYAPLANSETWRDDVDELGDGLFRYLILELSTEEELRDLDRGH